VAHRLTIDSLKPSSNEVWYDRDTIMLHAAFQCLVDFIDREKPEEISLYANLAFYNKPMPEEEKKHLHGEDYQKAIDQWKEVYALKDWWVDYVAGKFEKLDPIAEYEMEQEKFLSLVRLRGHLWV